MSERLAVLGAGSIGVAFALQFARTGHEVGLYEPADGRGQAATRDLEARLVDLGEFGLIQEDADVIAARVHLTADLSQAVTGAALLQECAPERVEVKRALFAQAAALAPDAVLASSSSAIVPSQTAGSEPWAARMLVGHPGNPPYLIPVIEVVPGPETDPEAVRTAARIYRDAGLEPVVLGGEIEGFVFNRLQGAVLREAYALLRDHIADVDAIDTVMRAGLGRRWSFMGPFETSDLNVRGGLEAHAARMGDAYERMGAERGQHDPWTPDLVAEATRQRRNILPLDQWDARVRWRDRELMRRLAADQ